MHFLHIYTTILRHSERGACVAGLASQICTDYRISQRIRQAISRTRYQAVSSNPNQKDNSMKDVGRYCKTVLSEERPRTPKDASTTFQVEIQSLDQVPGVFDAARHTDEAICDPHLETVFLQHVRVRHHGAGRDDALCGTEVLAETPRPLNVVHEPGAGLRPTNDVEPQHAPMHAIPMVLVGE